MTRHAVFLMVAVCVSSDKFLKNIVLCIFFSGAFFGLPWYVGAFGSPLMVSFLFFQSASLSTVYTGP